MQLTIPAHKKSVLEKKLVTINKKAVRNGFNPITAEFGEKYYKKVTWTFRHDVGIFQDKKVSVAFMPVTLDFTDLIKVNGFSVIGMLESTPEGNIVNIVIEDHGLDVVELRNKKDFYCEHCNTRRAYKYLGIVRNDETGEIRFVGKSCLSEYIGIDITTIIRMMDYDYFTNCVCPDDEVGYGGFPLYHDFGGIVVHAFNAMVAHDFVYDDSTKNDIVISYFEGAKCLNVISDEMLKAFTEYCISKEQSLNTFESNLFMSAKSGYVHNKCFNIVMGGFCHWLKQQKKIEAVAKENATNEFFGTVGKREEFELTATEFVTFEGYYGTGLIVKGVQTGTNNKFTWFTNPTSKNFFLETSNNGDLNVVEDSFKVAATIKEHKVDDKFGNSTVLSRITFK